MNNFKVGGEDSVDFSLVIIAIVITESSSSQLSHDQFERRPSSPCKATHHVEDNHNETLVYIYSHSQS